MSAETRTSCWDPSRDWGSEQSWAKLLYTECTQDQVLPITCLHQPQLSIGQQRKSKEVKGLGRWRQMTGLVIFEMWNAFADTPGDQSVSCSHSDFQARSGPRMHTTTVGWDDGRRVTTNRSTTVGCVPAPIGGGPHEIGSALPTWATSSVLVWCSLVWWVRPVGHLWVSTADGSNASLSPFQALANYWCDAPPEIKQLFVSKCITHVGRPPLWTGGGSSLDQVVQKWQQQSSVVLVKCKPPHYLHEEWDTDFCFTHLNGRSVRVGSVAWAWQSVKVAMPSVTFR